MGVKLIRWPSWPPLSSKKFEAIIVVRRLEGLSLAQDEGEKSLMCEIKWKGQKGALRSLRRPGKIHLTKEVGVGDGGVVEWNETFRSVCNFSGYKEGVFSPWEVSFTVLLSVSLLSFFFFFLAYVSSFSSWCLDDFGFFFFFFFVFRGNLTFDATEIMDLLLLLLQILLLFLVYSS
jgi:hypothetical protein